MRKGQRILEDMVTENSSDLEKERDIKIKEAQRVSNRIYSKRTTPRYSIFKIPKIKDKERLLKAAREKQYVIKKDTFIRLRTDYSEEILRPEKNGTIYLK